MSYDMRVKAPAKVNIGLRVLPGREDGYHGIESVFQCVPLYDVLYVKQTADFGCGCTVSCDGMTLPEENTLTLAYKAFSDVAGVSKPINVCLEKHIPAGAGLGGGSSDAAALVNALEYMYNVSLSIEDRWNIASKVGSDVFFFLSPEAMKSQCALVSGRGEIVKAFPSRQDLFFVLICPEVHSSTKDAYCLVDNWYAPDWLWSGPAYSSLVDEYNSDVKSWSFINSFETPLVKRFSQIGEALQDLKNAGAEYVQMSGSGSAVFGVFESSVLADNAAFDLRKKWKRCYSLISS
ncbi:MAG: 4-(cytidine 5'-diphospho)-2-C-methyl-D-erythritol kinase [Spirochaetaceae bacterium]|nr:4-(cytidine 5'-diphospho)-2-C-methyl-D-erythritol kinase [Spirochaetaceae bacterium]